MYKKIAILTLLFTFVFGTISFAHSGRTDSSGGHNCSEKSKAKGLCTGYHNHNGGGASEGSSSGSSSGTAPAATRNDKDCSDFATYDEVVEYWNSKGYSATYDPERLDGWGNAVDDGIPCEAPSGYDKTKINNSPEQVQFQKDQQEGKNGEQEGYAQGQKDGYQGNTSNNAAASGSDIFKNGYKTGYDKGYEEGKAKLETEKKKANEEGYSLGKKQDKISIPETYAAHAHLKAAFEEGFNQAVKERIEAKKEEYFAIGLKDGKNDVNNPPKEKDFGEAYQEGYEEGQKELKESYVKQGYEAAFSLLEYKKPDLKNEKFIDWYKKGFESNKEVVKIRDAALAQGKGGTELAIPEEYTKGEVVYKFYYEQGFKEYEAEKEDSRQTTAGGLGIAALAWLGRRFYVAKKMIG
ncbi:YHYH domain-containing protein [Mesobacillus jeotgali]|uniref:YHYH domain-containing protein n=1 Tax=Mesobacillus jeotgali TaxID=129985 RepID=UPI0009A5F7EC|nr:YHYH domain-containing protein [Mesobacillus jeotgali]